MTGPVRSRKEDLLSLINPPLAAAAAAECLAGAFIAGAPLGSGRAYLLALASVLLFAAGSVFGHYFDRTADAQLHPDRPLPSGRVPAAAAWQGAWGLLVPGVLLAAPLGRHSLLAAVAVALLVVLHACTTKGQWGIGFITMGAARAVNLLLGLTVEEAAVGRFAPSALPVLLYATGWAVLRSAGRRGTPPGTALMALVHVVFGLSALLYQAQSDFSYRVDSLPFLIALVGLVLPRFVTAVLDGRRPLLAEAVQFGFLGLTLLEATLAAGHAGILAGVAVCLPGTAVYAALRRWPISW